ncbi:mRNA-decapping enzyme subunit 2 [Sporothrix bragantina]|uniref:mRNA-decapping enzyme subunit 2 n=1 Tax=Sporothrix bragantina TaxID=671064 RepID=A0ABP0BUG2_9PEZI
MTSQKMKLNDWLDDLCVRFIINLPQADLASMARICFQVEEAHWFYDDFIRPLDRSLPAMSLRIFCLAIFKRCPLLAPFPIETHIMAFEEFLKYKTSIPVRGAILLNEAMDMALLVKGWKKGANWSFPKGKINMDEDDLDCAVREVDEETGFDIRAAGLVPPPKDVKYIETTFRDQQIRLYVFRNVPMDTHFEPKTRKEIGGIQWYKIDDLPTYRKKTNGGHGHETDDPSHNSTNNKFYMVAQFTGQLKKWISQQRKKDAIRAGKEYLVPQTSLAEDPYTEDEGNALPEAVQNPPSGIAGDPTQILADASRELRQMLRMPPLPSDQPPAVDPSTAGYTDPNQNRANALLAVLQKGGSAPLSATPPGVNGGMSLNHLLAQVSQPNAHAPPPQHQQHMQQYQPQQAPYPQQQPPPPQYQQHQQQHQQPPPPFHQQMPQPGPPMQGQQSQPSLGYNQYAAPLFSPQQQQILQQHQAQAQQQAYNKAQLAQQNQHLQQRFQLQHPPQGQQPPQKFPFPGQQQPLPEQNTNPFAPNPQSQSPPPYAANGNNTQGQSQAQAQAHAQAQAAAAAFRSPQNPPPPIPLLHPQPLPPVVQKALFARELLVSPDVSGHQNNMMMPPPPPPPQQYRGQQPPLSNHAAALLSAFKKDDPSASPTGGAGPEAGGSGAPGAPGWSQQQQQQQQAPPQQQPNQQQHPRHVSHNVPPNPAQQLQQQQQPYATLPHSHQLHGARPQPAPQQQPYGAQQAQVQAQPNPAGGASNGLALNVYLPTNAPPTANSALQSQLLSRPTKHTDQHINSLLGMFNKQAAPAPTSQATALDAATGPPVPPQHTSLGHNARPAQAPGAPQGVTAQRTVYSATTISSAQGIQEPRQAQAIEAAVRANGGPIEMNAELNLPFGALSLLTRPKNQDGSNSNNAADRSQHPSTYASPIVELPASTTHVQNPPPAVAQQAMQLLASAANRQQLDSSSERRPSTRGSQQQQQQQYVNAPAVTATLPSHGAAIRRPSHASSSSTAPVEGGPFALGDAHQQHQQHHQHQQQANMPRPDTNPEQKQKLLSLFSKQPQMSPGAGRNPLASHPPPPHAHHTQHTPPVPGSSRGSMDRANLAPPVGHAMTGMDTLAAAPTDGMSNATSRRGSQTPISPANRSFLLGYLASVSGNQ